MSNTNYKIKNTTDATQKWGGMKIAPGAEYIIQEIDVGRLLSDTDFPAAIASGHALIKDEKNVNINPNVAITRIKEIFALGTLFESENTLPKRSNNYQAKNVQEAIEETRNKARFTITLTHNGSLSNNKFMGHANNIPGNTTPIIIPKNSVLEELTFSNKKGNADFDFELMKNDMLAAPFRTVQIIQKLTHLESGINESFNQGDTIYLKYKDYGINANDAVVQLVFRTI